MNKIYYHTINDENGIDTTYYYIEQKMTHEEYKKEFKEGIALKKNQKLITVRRYIDKPCATADISYKN